MSSSIEVPVSLGELIDKVTILEIKILNGFDEAHYELAELMKVYDRVDDSLLIKYLMSVLMSINLEIWKVEEEKRKYKEHQDFDDDFIDIARSVYYLNDLRAEVKRKINTAAKSEIREYKSHKGY